MSEVPPVEGAPAPPAASVEDCLATLRHGTDLARALVRHSPVVHAAAAAPGGKAKVLSPAEMAREMAKAEREKWRSGK